MAIVKDRTKERYLQVDSAEADGDLTAFQNCVVVSSAQSAGNDQVKAPTGQGVDWRGVVINTADEPATDGKLASIVTRGVVKIKAAGAINSGVLVAIDDTDGNISAAGSGDYVVGKTREAANAAGHLISVELVAPGTQLN